jgi:sugar phosphate permease
VFFGWWIVAGGVGIQTLIAGVLNQAYGAYVVILQDTFGWSKTSFSIAYAIQQAESGLLGPMQGWLLDRFGPRNIMRVGLVLLGLGFILFSQIDTLTGFYLAFLVMAIGSSLGGFMSIVTTIVHWFERRRGTALAIMQTGAGIGGLLVPLVAWSLETNGWRATAFGSGVLVIVLGLPLTTLMRHRPEQYGLVPDGIEARKALPSALSPQPSALAPDFTARQALRTPAFWTLSLGHSLGVMVVAAVSVHLVPYLTEERGYSLAGAAGVVSAMTTTMMAGQLSGGLLGDRFSKRLIATLATCGHVLAMLVLAYASVAALVIGGAMLQGLSHGLRGVQMMPLRADYFGRRAFATIAGFSSLVMTGFIMAGPIMVGRIADQRGHYQLGFQVLAVVAAIGALMFAVSARPRTSPPASPLEVEGNV